jgi:4-oxalocrotonate tautomerase
MAGQAISVEWPEIAMTAPGTAGMLRDAVYQPQGRLITSEECKMPFINVKVIEGVFSVEQKREIAERLSETMIDIEGESMREVTMVVIDETKSEDWAIGGRCLSTEAVRALAAQSTGANS